MASAMLSETTFAPGSPALERESASAPAMTLRGTIVTALLLLLLAFVFGAIGWNNALVWFADESAIWWIVGFIVLTGLTIAAAANPRLA
jgi:hypothetical protein